MKILYEVGYIPVADVDKFHSTDGSSIWDHTTEDALTVWRDFDSEAAAMRYCKRMLYKAYMHEFEVIQARISEREGRKTLASACFQEGDKVFRWNLE